MSYLPPVQSLCKHHPTSLMEADRWSEGEGRKWSSSLGPHRRLVSLAQPLKMQTAYLEVPGAQMTL